MSTISCPSKAPVAINPQREELVNTLTHGLGAALSLVGAVVLVTEAVRTGDIARIVGCSIYAATLFAVYAASTLSHVYHDSHLRGLWRTLDQAFIYLLIVGTYTPLAMVYLHGGWLSVLFGAMWTVAILGFLSKTLWRHQVEAVSVTAYAVLGWMPVMSVRAAWHLLPGPVLLLMIVGGLFYTLGLIFLLRDHKVPFFHGVWHLFVMAGSTCHFIAILGFVAQA
jgi:hemolysin III